MIVTVQQRPSVSFAREVPEMNEWIFCKRLDTVILVSLALSAWLASPALHAAEMQVARYSVLRTLPTPEQLDPLAAHVTVRFPESVQTLGQAVQHLLQDSGYRLARPSTAASATLLELPLPGVQRSLGPVTLRQALAVLGGPVFRLVQDPLHRLVAFERCAAPGPSDGLPAKDPVMPEGEDAWGR